MRGIVLSLHFGLDLKYLCSFSISSNSLFKGHLECYHDTATLACRHQGLCCSWLRGPSVEQAMGSLWHTQPGQGASIAAVPVCYRGAIT